VQSSSQEISNHFSTVGYSVSKAAKAKADRISRNKVYRAHRRATDERFAQSERDAAKRWRDENLAINKSCQEFAEAYASQYQQFLEWKNGLR
jgi:hypothetical protein